MLTWAGISEMHYPLSPILKFEYSGTIISYEITFATRLKDKEQNICPHHDIHVTMPEFVDSEDEVLCI